MAFIAIDHLSMPSKVAIFKLCFGNILFVVLGAASMAFGGYFLNKDNLVRFAGSYIQGAPDTDVAALLDEHTYQILAAGCMILIACGMGVTVISALGFCGAVTRNEHCMFGYLVFLILLVIAEVISLSIFSTFKARLDYRVQTTVRDGIIAQEYQFGKGVSGGITSVFDFIQMQYDCCGVTGAIDYTEEGTFTNWRHTFPYNSSRDDLTNAIPIPPFCCKFVQKLSWPELIQIEGTRDLTFTTIRRTFRPYFQYPSCLDNTIVNPEHAWINKGCYSSFIKKLFNSLYSTLTGLALTILLFEVICLLAALILTCDMRSVRNLRAKKEERKMALKVEKDTILAGIQATGSLAQHALSGALQSRSVMRQGSRMSTFKPAQSTIHQPSFPY